MGLLNKLFNGTPTPKSSIIENISIQRLVPKCKEWNVDTIFITTRKNCPLCSQYNRKVYSLYGWNKKYSKIPDILLKQKCPECGGSIGATIYQPGINTPIKK
ncbi:MAG: hypothetical protein KHZ58_12310 [Hungatella hathewayi]|nr:hypothetical protein [Hungatella hathewayi]